MPLEPTFFVVGTGYVSRDAADTQTIAVSLADVAVVACGYMADREPVVCLYSSTGHVLAALPWPKSVHSDADAVRWALEELRVVNA